MNSCLKIVALLAISMIAFVETGVSKVAGTSLSKLTTDSDQIVMGTVVGIESVEGLTVATLEVKATIKGLTLGHLYFLAQPTWTCDTSEAKLGEHLLLFLNRYRFGYEGMDLLGFKEPKTFKAKIERLTGYDPFFAISWSGRGRMPLRTIEGIEYATLWTGDVRLPGEMTTIDGPEKKYSSFIRSARLEEIMSAIRSQVALDSQKASTR